MSTTRNECIPRPEGEIGAPCSPDIYKDGEVLLIADSWSVHMESWVQMLAKDSGARLDWHYVGGRAVLKHLGDAKSREAAISSVETLKDELVGSILRYC